MKLKTLVMPLAAKFLAADAAHVVTLRVANVGDNRMFFQWSR